MRVFDSLLHEDGRSLLGCFGDSRFEFVRGDVRDAAAVEGALDGVGAVVHLAAIVGDPACSREPDEAREVNLEAPRANCSTRRRAQGRRAVRLRVDVQQLRQARRPAAYATEEFELQARSRSTPRRRSPPSWTCSLATARTSQTTCLRLRDRLRRVAADALRPDGERVHARRRARAASSSSTASSSGGPTSTSGTPRCAIADVLEAEASLVAGEVFNVGDTARELPEGRTSSSSCGSAIPSSRSSSSRRTRTRATTA